MEVLPDHVHLFVQADHTTAPAEIAKTLTSISAAAVFTRFPTLKGRRFWGSGLWSESTYYGSVGHICEATVRPISRRGSDGRRRYPSPPTRGGVFRAILINA